MGREKGRRGENTASAPSAPCQSVLRHTCAFGSGRIGAGAASEVVLARVITTAYGNEETSVTAVPKRSRANPHT